MHEASRDAEVGLERGGRAGRRPAWRSRSLLVMAVMTVIGAGMWVYAAATRPESAGPAAEARAADGTGGARVNSLTGTGGGASAAPAAEDEDVVMRARRAIDDGAPALFRFGLGFVMAFFAGWMLRKFVKVTLLAAGALGLAAYGLHRAGVLGLDSAGIDTQSLRTGAERGAEWVKSQGGAVREVVTGYLPTGVASALGLYKGFRAG